MQYEKVLIAGGIEFVGQNTARLYADSGTPVIVTSRKDKDLIAKNNNGIQQYNYFG